MSHHEVKKYIFIFLLFAVILCVALYWSVDQLESSRSLENSVQKLTKAEILARASYDASLTSVERNKIEARNWTLQKQFISEAKGRGDFRVLESEINGVCLTAFRRSNELAIHFHKQCSLSPEIK